MKKFSKPSKSFATYFFLFLMVVFTATLSVLLVINAKEDWEYRSFFCDESFRNQKDSRLISGNISPNSIPDPESGFVVYNVEYQTKRNHWNLYQVSVGSFFLVLNDKSEVLVSNESGLANHNFDNKERTFKKPHKPSEAQLRLVGAKRGDTITVVYDKSQSLSDENGIQASSVYAGSSSDLCQEETANAITALVGAFAFALISLGLSYMLWKEWLRIYKINIHKS